MSGTTPELPSDTDDGPAAPPIVEPPKRSGVATAALIVGIVAIVAAVIPFVSFGAVLPAIAALALGIIAIVLRTARRGRAISGMVLGGLALVVAVVVSIATVGVLTSNLLEPQAIPPSPTAPDAETPEPSEVPTPTPSPSVAGEIVYTGTGDFVQPIELVDGDEYYGVATIEHSGSSNFTVTSLDADMASQALLINRIGVYEGTVLFNIVRSEVTTAFEITADGAWTITMRSLASLDEFEGTSATGFGDDVVIYRGAAGTATVRHEGTGDFSVVYYTDSVEVLLASSGEYDGTTPWKAGLGLVQIEADGDWSIVVA